MASIASAIHGIKPTIITPENQYGPEKTYTARQESFQKKSDEIAAFGAESIQKIRSAAEPDFPALFHDLIAQFANERQKIAEEAGTINAELFGKPTGDLAVGYYLYTELLGTYKPANDSAIEQLHQAMDSMPRSLTEFIQKTKKVSEKILGRQFSYQIDIIDSEYIKEKNWHKDADLPFLEKFRKKVLEEIPEDMPKKDASKELFKKLKEAHPEMYKRGKMYFHLNKVQESFPSPTLNSTQSSSLSGNDPNLKSDYVLVTLRTQIGKQMVATTQWLTWLYRSFNRDPIERMLDPKRRPIVTVIHEDLFLKEISLKECANIFNDIMRWDQNTCSEKDLKNQVALLRYLFAHTMPYFRGSAAIGEWLEASIYRALGFSCSYEHDYVRESVDLVALTKLKFSDYLKRYHQLVKLSLLETN